MRMKRSLAAVLIATILSYGVARTVTRPIAAITAAMREIAATGDLTRKIRLSPGSREDEDARLLATTFNTLTDSIARFQREMSQKERLTSLGRLSTVIAHEIRNPLMIIKSALHVLRQPVESTPVGPLLRDKCHGQRAAHSGGIECAQQLDQGGTAEAVADGRGRHLVGAHFVGLALERDGVEDVHAGLADLGGRLRADINVNFVGMPAARRVLARGLQVRGKARDDPRHRFALARPDDNGLHGVQQVKERGRRGLRQPLHAQITVGGDGADDVAGLVHRRDDQPARRAAAEGHVDVAHVVGLRRELFQFCADLGRQRALVAQHGRCLRKLRQVRAQILRGGGRGQPRCDSAKQDESREAFAATPRENP